METDVARRWMMPDALDLRFSTSQSPTRSDMVKDEPQSFMPIDTAQAVEVDFEHLPNTESPGSLRHSSSGYISEEAVKATHDVPRSTSLVGKISSSSSLSSAASVVPSKSVELDVDMDRDDGNESDATSVTVERSHDFESEGEDNADVDVERTAEGLRIAKQELPEKSPGSISNDKHRLDEMPDDCAQANDSEALKETKLAEVDSLKSRPSTMENYSPISTGPRRSRKNRIVSSPTSVDGEVDMDDAMSRRPRSRDGSIAAAGTNKLKEICVVTPDQVVSHVPKSQKIPESRGGLAAKTDMMVDDVLDEREMPPFRAPTLLPSGALDEREMNPPRAPSPLPKESTPPPPEPPKKVSLSEYLKNHKIRKESLAIPSTLLGSPSDETSFDEISGLTPSASAALVKVEPQTTSTRVNLFEHLPSSRTPNVTTPSLKPTASPHENVKSVVTPSAAYNPRAEYFPIQPAPVFAPRVSSSYTPRQTSLSSLSEPEVQITFTQPRPVLQPNFDVPSSYVSRLAKEPTPPFLPGQTDERPLTPPIARLPTPAPAPAPARDAPPHQRPQTPTPAHRAPPTGPKMPPTGPRASWNPPVSPAIASPVRGGFSPAPTRGFGGSRGGFTGDRSGFGGERGGFGPGFGERGGFFRGRGLFRGRGGRGG